MALLTVDEFRALVNTSLETSALELLLDAAEEAIDARIGPVGEFTEYQRLDPYKTLIELPFKPDPSEEVEITVAVGWDDEMELADDDWILDGRFLYRHPNGTNPDDYWLTPVQIVFTPYARLNDRKRVQAKLVELDILHKPGLSSFTVGKHSESGSGAARGSGSYEDQREELLASLEGSLNPVFA